MLRFADPAHCPDCRSSLPRSPQACPTCALPLTGPLASRLFATLQDADRLLAQLRASTAPIPEAVRVPAAAAAAPGRPSAPVAPGAPIPTGAPVPPGATGRPPWPPPPAPPRARGITGASIPKILLGIGALCLLVAALTFLAVAWSLLGVGGRTLVLVALTAAATGAGLLLLRRGLRAAAEALTTVGLGLLALDVIGAESAGWFGELDFSATMLLTGLVIGASGITLALYPRERLIAPQVIAVLGLSAAVSGALGAQETHPEVVLTASLALLIALAAGARQLRLTTLYVGLLVTLLIHWFPLLALGLGRAVVHHSYPALILQGHAWPLAAAATLIAVPAALPRANRWLRVAGAAIAVTILSFVAVLPPLDQGSTQATGALLILTVVMALVGLVLPQYWRPAVAPVTGLGMMATLTVLFALLGYAATAVVTTGDPWSVGPGVRLAAVTTEPNPHLFVPLVLGFLLGLVSVSRLVTEPWAWLRKHQWSVGLVVAGAVAAWLLLLAPPLAAVVLLVVLLGLVGLVVGHVRTDAPASVLGGISLAVALFIAAPAAWLTLGVFGAITGAAVLLALTDTTPVRIRSAALVTLPLALGCLLWNVGQIAEVDVAFRAAPVLLLLGTLAVVRPLLWLEIPAAVAATLATLAAVPAADRPATSLALHLTLGGVIVVGSSLLNANRRPLGWVGGLLLAMASWVRLWDVGVDTPEAYTLPSALALLIVGLVHLHRNPGASTGTALTPGLSLATVPSLLWVLADTPLSLRGALLGLGCLAILLAGVALRWSAPVVVGGIVGALLVLRAAAPYAAEIPPWILIGFAGTLLTVVGVTWESRMRDLRTAAGYLTRLR